MTYITASHDETNFAWHFEGPIDILLDGRRVFGCLEADDEARFIVQTKYENGELVAIDGNIQTIKLYGKVEIIGKRRPHRLDIMEK